MYRVVAPYTQDVLGSVIPNIASFGEAMDWVAYLIVQYAYPVVYVYHDQSDVRLVI